MEIKIYTLSSSRSPNDIRYVGKTKQSLRRRLQGHICCAKRAKKSGYCTNHNYNWINHEIELGNSIIIEELDSMEFAEDEDWSWFEKYWVAQMKEWGFSLTNIKEGGEDNHASKPAKEVIRARAEKCIGKSRDEKTKQSISKGLTGIHRSEETKEKVRQAIISKQGRPVLQYSKEGKFIKEWESGATAAKELGLDKANINSCCRGKRKLCGGYTWKYKEETKKDYRIIQLSLSGEYIDEFENSTIAGKELGIHPNLINRVCRGIQPQTYNFIFKYSSDYNP